MNVLGGVLHFHGHNSYSAIVCGCEIVWNSVCLNYSYEKC